MVNLRSVDLNLLPGFEAVYEERNLTSASHRLAMSQPAASNPVARLRDVFKDERSCATDGASIGRQPRTPSMRSCTAHWV